MLFFDLIKPKAFRKEFPSNPLEVALMRAAKHFNARCTFYKLLLNEELYTVIDGEQTLREAQLTNIIPLKDGKLPIFTSKERIFDNGIFRKTISYTHLKGKDLFTKTQGASFMLNPFSDYGKTLACSEITQLLDGSIFDKLKAKSKVVSIQNHERLVLYIPKKQPQEMLTALQDFFKNVPQVNAAYIGGIRLGEEEQPHWILGVDCDSCIEKASQKLGPLAMSFLNNQMLDIMDINQNEGVRDYLMANTKPFYTKASE